MLMLGVQSRLFTTPELKKVSSASDLKGNTAALGVAASVVSGAVVGVGQAGDLKVTLEI